MPDEIEFVENLVDRSIEQGDPSANLGVSVAERELNRIEDTTKRDLMRRSCQFLGIMLIGRRILRQELRQELSQGLRRGFDSLIDVAPLSSEITPRFVSFFNDNKTRPDLQDLVSQRIPNITTAEAAALRAYRALDSGTTILAQDYVTLRAASVRYTTGSIAVFVRTYLASSLVRIGYTHDAAALVNGLSLLGLTPRETLAVCEQTLSANYVSLDPRNALAPQTWQFHQALQNSRSFLQEFGANIDPNSNLTFPDRISGHSIRSVVGYDVRGFYLLFYAILYYSAGKQDSAEQRFCSDLMYNFFRDLLKFSLVEATRFYRAIWNGAFIIALQFHRQANFAERNRFLNICLLNTDFWGQLQSIDRMGVGPGGLKGTEIIPMMAALFMRSTPGLISKLDHSNLVPSTQRILSHVNQMSISSARQSIDVLRRDTVINEIEQGRLSLLDLVITHGLHLGGNRIFHLAIDDIRRNLAIP